MMINNPLRIKGAQAVGQPLLESDMMTLYGHGRSKRLSFYRLPGSGGPVIYSALFPLKPGLEEIAVLAKVMEKTG